MPKTKLVWKVCLWSLPIQVEIARNKKIRSTGYVAFHETEREAIDYKTKQLTRVKAQFDYLKEPLPETYKNQISEMERIYGKEKTVSQ